MTNRTVTARNLGFTGKVAGIQFTNGVATADDATDAGKRVIALAKRQGWAVSGGINAAVTPTVDEGKPVEDWTTQEMKDYLDANHVEYPSGASDDDLRAAILTAYETRAQGGSAAQDAAGHTQGTFPVEGAPNVPGDDDEKAAQWHTPLAGVPSDVLPTITDQPDNVSVTAPATATFTVAATGTPEPEFQWQRQAAGAGAWTDIEGADEASFTTPATTVTGGAANNTDKYRVIVSNTDGSVTSNAATLTVTA